MHPITCRTTFFSILVGVLLTGTAALAASVAPPDHVVIVVEENQSANQIYGNPDMPYFNQLAQSGATMTNSAFAETPYGTVPNGYSATLPSRPSQPNYLYLFSGNNQGVRPDWFQQPTSDPSYPYRGTAINDPNGNALLGPVTNAPVGIANNQIPSSQRPFTTPNLGSAVINGGGSFASFSESLPYPHFDGTQDPSAADEYRRKHNPAINWVNLPNHAVPADKQRFVLPVSSNLGFVNTVDPIDGKSYRGFAVDAAGQPLDFSHLPTVSLVVANEQNDAHSNSNAVADQWLIHNIKPYADWALTHNSLLIVTYDEDGTTDSSHGDPYKFGKDKIATLFYGPMVHAGLYGERIDHLNLLSTILNLYGDLDTFKRDFAAAFPTEEGQRELANLLPILDVFGAGPALTSVPEPSSLGLVLSGLVLLALAWSARRGRSSMSSGKAALAS